MFLEWIGRRQAACFDAESRRSVPLFLPERVLVATETLEFVKSLRIPSRVMDCLLWDCEDSHRLATLPLQSLAALPQGRTSPSREVSCSLLPVRSSRRIVRPQQNVGEREWSGAWLICLSCVRRLSRAVSIRR